jgi:hypothetical protein
MNALIIMNSTSAYFQTALRDAYASITGTRRSILLPDHELFQMSGDKEILHVYMKSGAVLRNMQENVASFEGWILALKAWGCIGKAVLDWQEPMDKTDGNYQRFLYRVDRFRNLFPWFSVVRENLLNDSKLLKTNKLVLNGPTRIAKVPDQHSREAEIEKNLAESEWLKSEFHLVKTGRQFPVGLFTESVANKNKVFTGGKSAIDLVGIDKNSELWVFELKAEGNQSLGILSELLFYTSMMADLANGIFSYEDNNSAAPEGRLHPSEVVGVKKIHGSLIASKFHPLLSNERILNLLKRSTSQIIDYGPFKILPEVKPA